MSNILNNIFKAHKNEIDLKLFLLLPIPKPSKMKGPPKNLRPINTTKCYFIFFSHF